MSDRELAGTERIEALSALLPGIDDWVAAVMARSNAEAPATEADVLVVSQALSVLLSAGGSRVDQTRLDGVQGRWLAWLLEQPTAAIDGARLAAEVSRRFTFVLARSGARAALDVLDANTMARIEAADDVTGLIKLLAARGDVRRALGEMGPALADLERAHELLRRRLAEPWSALQLASVGVKLEIDLGRIERAAKWTSDMLALARAHPDEPAIEVHAYLAEIRLLEAFGQTDLMLGRCEALTEMLKRLSPQSPLRRTTERQARSYAALARAGLARDANERESALEEITAQLDDDRVATADPLTLTLGLERAVLSAALDIDVRADLEQLLAEGVGLDAPLARAGYFATIHAIARTNGLETIRRSAFAHLEGAIASYERCWLSIADEPGGVGFLEYDGRRRVLSELIEGALASSGGTSEALEAVLRFERCGSTVRALARSLGLGELPSAQSALRAAARTTALHDAQLLVLVVSDEVSHAFVVEGEAPPRHVRLPGVEALAPDVATASDWLADPRPEANDPGALRLGDVVLGCLGRNAGDERPLWVVGWQPLAEVPIEALPTTTGAPLGLRFPISHPLAVCALPWEVPSAERARSGELVVFGLEAETSSGDIQLTAAEKARIASAARGRHVRFLSNRNASKGHLLEAFGAGSDLIVLWTHGSYRRTELYPGGVVIDVGAGDERESLGALEFASALASAGLESAPRTVFLASCRADLGNRRLGDPLSNRFSGVLLSHGVAAVIGSRGDLHRNATRDLLSAFVAGSAGEERPPESRALWLARRSVAANDATRSPHFWGQLSLHHVGARSSQ